MPSNRMSDKGMELLMSIESFKDKPYDDQNGNAISNWVKGATIGYGHLISQDEWNQLGAIIKTALPKHKRKHCLCRICRLSSTA